MSTLDPVEIQSLLLWLVPLLALTGIIAGVIAGLLGVGGGIVIVPVLYHVFSYLGIDAEIRMHLAVGTSLATIIPTSIRSALSHYRKGAFDYYDTIFCSGPHHVKEVRAMEAEYKLPPKILLEHGYGRLDSIIEKAKKRPGKEKRSSDAQHILIAPSWGPDCTIESGAGEKIVDQLLENGFKVTLRPHPQTIKFTKAKIDAILEKHSTNNLFDYEDNVASQESLHASDIMISDWSGAALDYSFGLGKPVVFVDVPRKINNSDYQEIGIEPFEVSIRETIGQVLDVDNINNIAEI